MRLVVPWALAACSLLVVATVAALVALVLLTAFRHYAVVARRVLGEVAVGAMRMGED
jgi:hypothetical protein